MNMQFNINYENLAEFLDAWNHRTHVMTDEDIQKKWKSLNIARTFVNGILYKEYKPIVLKKETKTDFSKKIKIKLKSFNFTLKKNI